VRGPGLSLCPYSPDCVERLYEKVHEQRLERGFSRYTEREEGPRVLCSATLQAPPTLFGQSRKRNSPKFAWLGLRG
jgi:hypothetical protein